MARVEVTRESDGVWIQAGGSRILVPVGEIPALVAALVRESGESDAVLAELTAFGVDPHVARKLAGSVTLSQVRGWLAYANEAEGLRNVRGFVVARLQAGEWPPDTSRRWLSGPYGDLVER